MNETIRLMLESVLNQMNEQLLYGVPTDRDRLMTHYRELRVNVSAWRLVVHLAVDDAKKS